MIHVSETRHTVVWVGTREKDHIFEVIEGLGVEEGSRVYVMYLLVCSHDKMTSFFLGHSEDGCIVEMDQAQVVRIRAVLGPVACLLKERADVTAP